MNHFAMATKVWQKAQKENNRLILDNCTQEDLTILVRDGGPYRSVSAATTSINNMLRIVVGFKDVQAARKGEEHRQIFRADIRRDIDAGFDTDPMLMLQCEYQ